MAYMQSPLMPMSRNSESFLRISISSEEKHFIIFDIFVLSLFLNNEEEFLMSMKILSIHESYALLKVKSSDFGK